MTQGSSGRRLLLQVVLVPALWVVVALGIKARPQGLPTAQAADKPPSGKTAAPKLTAADVVRRMERAHEATKTIRAKFRHRFWHRAQGSATRAAGTMVFKADDKFAFRYTSPKGDAVVRNGKWIYSYKKKEKRVYKTRVRRSLYPDSLRFLAGEKPLSAVFKFRLLSDPKGRLKRGVILEARPKDSSPAYRRIVLYVDTQSFLVRRLMVVDSQGNRNRFEFYDVATNVKVKKSEFRFKVPRGSRVVRP